VVKKDYLLDLVEHTYDLGCISLVKIVGDDSTTSMSGLAEDLSVVVQGNYAYVTLRNGTLCNRGATQLEIIDISNVESPYLLKTIPMLQPHGLDIDGKNLIVTEGNNGFKWFDASNPINPQQILFEKNVAGFDIISRGSEFILIGADGLFQYEYGNNSLTLLSKIPVSKP
jgi:hypothetical protein